MMHLSAFLAARAAAAFGQIARGALAARSFFAAYSQGPLSPAARAKSIAMLHQLANACNDEMPNQSAELRCLASCD